MHRGYDKGGRSYNKSERSRKANLEKTVVAELDQHYPRRNNEKEQSKGVWKLLLWAWIVLAVVILAKWRAIYRSGADIVEVKYEVEKMLFDLVLMKPLVAIVLGLLVMAGLKKSKDKPPRFMRAWFIMYMIILGLELIVVF